MCGGRSSTSLADNVYCCPHRHRLNPIRFPVLFEASTSHVVHREVAKNPLGNLQHFGIEYTDDVWMANLRENDRFLREVIDLGHCHVSGFEDLRGVAAEKGLTHLIYLGKCAFA